MPRYLKRKESRYNGLLLASIGAAAGILAGVLIADRVGGLDRLFPSTGRFARKHEDKSEDLAIDEPWGLHDADGNLDYYDYEDGYDEDSDDDQLSPESITHLHIEDRNPDRSSEKSSRDRVPDLLTLETRVLEAFHNDPVLRERAIDIGAIAPGVIELTGWVHGKEEVLHASTIARGVPDVAHVVDQLSVRKPSRIRSNRKDSIEDGESDSSHSTTHAG